MSALVSRWIPLGLGAVGLLSLGGFASFASGFASKADVPVVAASGRSVERGSAAAQAHVRAEGRVVAYPGAEVAVSVEVLGRVVRLPVAERSVVKAGDLLLELEGDAQRAAVAEAEALLVERRAEARFAANELQRSEKSRRENVVSEQHVDAARRERDVAEARIGLAEAGLARAQSALAKTRITSPIAGTVIERRVHEGETVAPGTRALVIADLSRTRIEAEVDEFDIAALALGARAVVSAEGDPGPAVTARVEELPDAVQPRRLAPEDPGRATDTRVARVKIALDAPHRWKLGQRVEVSIDAAR